MDPFGNFGWNFGFGFGWILTGITAMLLILGIVQLFQFSFKDEQAKAEELEAFKMLKKDICAGKISFEEFEERARSRT